MVSLHPKMVKCWHCDMHSAPDPDSVQWNADQAGTSWCSLCPTLRNEDGYIFITVHIILYLCKKFPFIHYLCEIDIHCSGRSPATHETNSIFFSLHIYVVFFYNGSIQSQTKIKAPLANKYYKIGVLTYFRRTKHPLKVLLLSWLANLWIDVNQGFSKR